MEAEQKQFKKQKQGERDQEESEEERGVRDQRGRLIAYSSLLTHLECDSLGEVLLASLGRRGERERDFHLRKREPGERGERWEGRNQRGEASEQSAGESG